MKSEKSEDSKLLQSPVKRRPPAAGIGRAKGVPNKTTALLKDAILLAARAADPSKSDPAQKSLEGYLAWAAVETPGPFLGLIGKILPLQIANAGEGAFKIEIVKFNADDPASK
jgi:hypothetical protein